MEWLAHALRENPELGLFLVLAIGFGIGQVRFGRFRLGPAPGTLIAGMLVGQIAGPMPDAMKSAFFLMFIFALGFRTGPEFFQSLRASGPVQLVLITTLCVVALVSVWIMARVWQLDGGTAAGLLAGAMTNSTALGSAADATAALGLDASAAAGLSRNLATTYALTYVFGLVSVVWLLPYAGPWLMRVNLRDASSDFEQSIGLPARGRSVNAAYRAVLVRSYRIPPAMDGLTVAEIEGRWEFGRRVVIVRIRRGEVLLDADPAMLVRHDDVVALAGRPDALIGGVNPLVGLEVDDREVLEVPTISADLVFTTRELAGRSLAFVAEQIGARDIFLSSLRRGGRELPFTATTIIERGDVLRVSGTHVEIARVAAQVGFVEYPTAATDIMMVAGTILAGGLIGVPALVAGRFTLNLTVPVGVMLAGLLLGRLRSIHPRFGRVPEASVWLLESLGLTAFLAIVGLQAGPALLEAVEQSGLALIVASVVIAIVPHVVTILLGYYVAGVHPAILLGLCAGAGTSAPALAALEDAADSRVPALGYGLACAVGNILMAVGGTLLVMIIGG